MARERKSLAQRIEADKEALRRLQERISANHARLQKVERATDTRRKILLGAWVLEGLQKQSDDAPWAQLRAHFDDFRGFLGERNASLFPADFLDAPAAPEPKAAE